MTAHDYPMALAALTLGAVVVIPMIPPLARRLADFFADHIPL